MARDAAPIDIATLPELARLVREVERTRIPQLIEENGKPLALLVPAGGAARRKTAMRLIDTSALPPVPQRTIDDQVASRPTPPARAFTDEEIATAVDEDRAEAWRRNGA